mmetsp:Transcript_973/g.1335  ORF Transcript_973/g.1335 Transcript_973/m.1335 type:complete len:269 (-) Transcript_973:33-839(-)
MSNQSEQYTEYFNVAKSCAVEAGKVIKEAWHRPTHVQFKAATDLVTETDKACENLIMSTISKNWPEHKFIAEETVSEGRGKEELSDDPTWIIDPLDGTINFVHRIPIIGISIALAIKKQVVVGIVFNPILDEMYTAIRGQGAFLNGHKIHVTDTSDLKKALVSTACGAELDKTETDTFLHRMDVIIQNCRSWRRTGSAANDMCFVAAGRIDIYCEKGIHAWDIAAGALLVEEAGGVLSDVSGGALDICKRQILATNPHLQKKFLESTK